MAGNLPPGDDLRDVLCEDRAGFLFDHPCKRFARLRCSRCQKPICERHRHAYQGAEYCTACAQSAVPAGGAYYDDTPYFYGRRYHPYYTSFWLYDDDPDYGQYNDFTDADAASTAVEGDPSFENDLGAS